MFHYDKLLASIGGFGVYQKRLWFLICVLVAPNGITLTSVVFNHFTPNFRCAVPGLVNDTYHIQNADHGQLVKESIPYDEEDGRFSQCQVYASSADVNESLVNSNKTRACHRWVYDDVSSGMSMAVELDMVCDRAIYKAHMSSMVLVGLLFGSLLGGGISDLFGRKRTSITAILAVSILGGVMALVDSIALLMVLRALVVTTGHSSFMASVVLSAETTGVSKRSIATVSCAFGFTFGCYLLVMVQYLIRDWRTAQLVQSLYSLSYIVYWWLIQESPRWLLAKGRPKEAQAILEYIAKVNGSKMPSEMKMLAETEKTSDVDGMTNVEPRVREVKFWHMCSQPRLAFRMTLLCFSWIVISMVYYGLLLGVGELIEGDIYVNFVLQASVELLGCLICIAILERTGRKKIFCSSMLCGGGATLGIALLILIGADSSLRWLSILLFCLGKLGMTLSFALIYVITTELLPTKIRNSGLGFCSCVARVSGIVSPYIANASLLIPGTFGRALPLIVFGALSLMSGLSAILLPETRNKELPETFDDDRERCSCESSDPDNQDAML